MRAQRGLQGFSSWGSSGSPAAATLCFHKNRRKSHEPAARASGGPGPAGVAARDQGLAGLERGRKRPLWPPGLIVLPGGRALGLWTLG
ncbi:unnamed protein product [Lampetra fluviatilis]